MGDLTARPEAESGAPYDDRGLGDPQSFIALYDTCFQRIYNYIRYRVEDRVTAEDLVSRVFERALDRADTFVPQRGTAFSWLMGIARNTVNMHLRTKWRRRWLSLDALGDRVAGNADPEQAALQAESLSELMGAIAYLSQRERHLIALKFGAELRHREIARLTGLSESNVGVIVHRAMRRLRERLDDRSL